MIAEYAAGAAAGSPNKEYIYSGSKMLATIAAGTATYQYYDHLSLRAEANTSGTATRSVGTLPFGDNWYDSSAGSTNAKWKFTSYERDSETIDYAIFRSSNFVYGRFMQPDLLAGDIGDPQSLNRYTYVGNNPISFSDPLGLRPCLDLSGNTVDCPDNTDPDAPDVGRNGGSSNNNGGAGGERGFHPPIQDIGPDIAGKGRARAKNLLKERKCADFVEKLLQLAFRQLNEKSKAQGFPPSQTILQNQQDASTVSDFTKTMDASGVEYSPTNRDYAATAGVTVIYLDMGFGKVDIGITFIHETFHLAHYGFSDVQLANALNVPYKNVPNDPQKTMDNASEAWNRKLEQACASKKKK